MRFLLDQGLPRSALAALRDRGHDAVHVGDIGMAAASDEAILREAARDGRVAVTLDADFHALIALSGAKGPSSIGFRIEGLKADRIASLLHQVAGSAASDIEGGAVVSIDETSVRVRKLPILRS
jgi:predicted nuclease of predicted toxin-antitoxin system